MFETFNVPAMYVAIQAALAAAGCTAAEIKAAEIRLHGAPMISDLQGVPLLEDCRAHHL